jgi:uncharacterized membrane-anchored protein YitT (DUF2179 family)
MTQIAGRLITHAWYEDLQALLVGTLLVSLGAAIYAKAGLLFGGLAGLSMFLSYTTTFNFSVWFFALNLPFYFLAVARVGWRFTLKTLIAVTAISWLMMLTPELLVIEHVHPAFAAMTGGVSIGLGALVLIRHQIGMGGLNILAYYLQERWNLRAGYVLLSFDSAILVLGLITSDIDLVGYSLVGATVCHLLLAMNHRPARYLVTA